MGLTMGMQRQSKTLVLLTRICLSYLAKLANQWCGKLSTSQARIEEARGTKGEKRGKTLGHSMARLKFGDPAMNLERAIAILHKSASLRL